MAGSPPREVGHQHRGRVVESPLEPSGLLHQCQQAIQADRRPDAGQPPRGEQARRGRRTARPRRRCRTAPSRPPSSRRPPPCNSRAPGPNRGRSRGDPAGTPEASRSVQDRPQVGDPLGRPRDASPASVSAIARTSAPPLPRSTKSSTRAAWSSDKRAPGRASWRMWERRLPGVNQVLVGLPGEVRRHLGGGGSGTLQRVADEFLVDPRRGRSCRACPATAGPSRSCPTGRGSRAGRRAPCGCSA